MSDLWPVYVVSRHRSHDMRTVALLHAHGISCTVVHEPHEAEAYAEAAAKYPGVKLCVLRNNDLGVAYARSGALRQALADRDDVGNEWCWLLDDDIGSFFRRENRKMVKCSPMEALLAAQVLVASVPQAAIGALEYQQLAWSTTKPFALNSYCDVVVAINLKIVSRFNIDYDTNLRMKEDRDIVLQALTQSQRSVRVQSYAFGAPKNGSNKGGCQDDYKRAGLEAAESAKMVKKWPMFCTLNTKKDGREDVKIHWSAFRQK